MKKNLTTEQRAELAAEIRELRQQIQSLVELIRRRLDD
jgi:hypothetical protein